MSIFVTSLNITLQHEGGYANLGIDTECKLDDDRGGETLFGISRNNHKDSIIWNEVDAYKQDLSPFNKTKYSKINSLCMNNRVIMKEVQRIYFEEYWKRIKGDDIKIQENANVLFDMAVNAGHIRAIKLAQELLSLKVDGICGNITIKAINDCGKDFCNRYTNKRIEWYKSRKNKTYIDAWVNRANKFLID